MSIETLQKLFTQKKLTLSTAESCTGGHLAAAITARPGASLYYLGSVIAYSNDLKVNLLGVSPATIAKGAVSKETVSEMATGIIRLTNSDYSLAVSGIAGPDGGTPEKPVGTIWCAIGKKGGPAEAWLFKTNGTRSQIIEKSVQELIHKLLERISL